MGLPSTSTDTSSHTSLTGQPKFRKLPFLSCFSNAFALHSGKHGFAKCGHQEEASLSSLCPDFARSCFCILSRAQRTKRRRKDSLSSTVTRPKFTNTLPVRHVFPSYPVPEQSHSDCRIMSIHRPPLAHFSVWHAPEHVSSASTGVFICLAFSRRPFGDLFNLMSPMHP